MLALLCQAAGLVESAVASPTMQGFLAAARGLVIPSLLVVIARGLSIPSLRLAVVVRGLFMPSMRLLAVASIPGIGMPSRWLVAPCTRVAHAHCFTARLVLGSLGVEVARLALDQAPAHGSPRRATVTAAIVGAGAWAPGPITVAPIVTLAAVWHPTSGTRSSAAASFVVAVIAAALAVVTPVAVAAAAAPPRRRTTAAVHAYRKYAMRRLGHSRMSRRRRALVAAQVATEGTGGGPSVFPEGPLATARFPTAPR